MNQLKRLVGSLYLFTICLAMVSFEGAVIVGVCLVEFIFWVVTGKMLGDVVTKWAFE